MPAFLWSLWRGLSGLCAPPGPGPEARISLSLLSLVSCWLPGHKHGIAVAIEPIPLSDCMFVCIEHPLPSGEGADQHEQRGFRQVKIRDQGIDHPEPIAGIDEYARLALPRAQCAFLAGRFQTTHSGRADSDHPAPLRSRLIHRLGCLRADLEPLRVHDMVLDRLGSH